MAAGMLGGGGEGGVEICGICAADTLVLYIPSFRDKARMWKKLSRG